MSTNSSRKLKINRQLSLQDIKFSQQNIILREKLDTLKSLDSNILELIDNENEDESIEHEVAEASEITDKIMWTVVRIDLTLKSVQINSPITSTPSTSTGNVCIRTTPKWRNCSFEHRNSRQITEIGNEKVQWSTDGVASVHRLYTF